MLAQSKLKQVWVTLLSPLDCMREKAALFQLKPKRDALLPSCGQIRKLFSFVELLISAVALWPQGGSRAPLSKLQALFRTDPLTLIIIFVFPSVAVQSLWILKRQADLKLIKSDLKILELSSNGKRTKKPCKL